MTEDERQPEQSQEVIFEDLDSEESAEIEVAPDRRTVRTQSADPQVTALHDKWKRGKLLLQPDFQRQFVWDRTKSSRLIESALLSVPIPVVYLAENPDGKESVIDGQQRLTALLSFLDGKFPGGESFKLTGLKVFQELNRKSFSELDDTYQDKIKYCVLRTITILKDSDPELKFEIFERLNTGSVPLNDMELRNCVYRGSYITLLKELAAHSDFCDLLGFKEPDKRMRDIELVLRFASFYHATYLNYKSPMRQFFNRDMEKYQHLSKDDADDLKSKFKNAIQIIKSLFGDSAFKRFHRGDQSDQNGAWETKKFNASLYDVMMGVFCNRDKNQVYSALDSVREALIDLMATNEEFIDAILLSTSSQSKVCKRFDLTRLAVDDLLKHHKVQQRCFTLELKKELFKANPTCKLCHQQIHSIDDAAVDHIKQYWMGGETIPANARLAHRYCNMARPRGEFTMAKSTEFAESIKASEPETNSRVRMEPVTLNQQQVESIRSALAEQRPSLLTAAAELLRVYRKPAHCESIVDALAKAKLYASPSGKTPAASLNAAIIREIAKSDKENPSRFEKVGPGLYGFAC